MVDILEKLKEIGGPSGQPVLRPVPTPDPLHQPIISVDDHFIEPPDTFTGRMPATLAERGPHIERQDGADHWVFEEERVPVLGIEGIAGWEPGHGHFGPIAFEDLRPGTYRIAERVRDMDGAGVLATLCFPSAIFGFAGQRFMRMADPELGLAAMRAYNDWIIEEWAGPFPERVIPSQVTWLPDPVVAAAEIRRNAERGFRAVAFTENPEKLGLPSIYQDHWDPFLAACAETGTVINLHVGSSSQTMLPSSDSDLAVLGVLFPVNGFAAAADWLFAKVPVRYPDIRIVLSEGGIGWVPIVYDRLDYMGRHADRREAFGGLTPTEVFARNFFFTTFSDGRSLAQRHEVGVDRIMFETDFPHTDSSWPDTQAIVATQLDGVDPTEADAMTFANAARLYRHPLPPELADRAAAAS
jgi:predicted TIM-barrel fold metal-dependent hydrolase